MNNLLPVFGGLAVLWFVADAVESRDRNSHKLFAKMQARHDGTSHVSPTDEHVSSALSYPDRYQNTMHMRRVRDLFRESRDEQGFALQTQSAGSYPASASVGSTAIAPSTVTGQRA